MYQEYFFSSVLLEEELGETSWLSKQLKGMSPEDRARMAQMAEYEELSKASQFYESSLQSAFPSTYLESISGFSTVAAAMMEEPNSALLASLSELNHIPLAADLSHQALLNDRLSYFDSSSMGFCSDYLRWRTTIVEPVKQPVLQPPPLRKKSTSKVNAGKASGVSRRNENMARNNAICQKASQLIAAGFSTQSSVTGAIAWCSSWGRRLSLKQIRTILRNGNVLPPARSKKGSEQRKREANNDSVWSKS